MELGITIPLQRFLSHNKPSYGIQTDLKLCWDLHVVKPKGNPSLFAVHCSSRFAFIMYNPSPAEWNNLTGLFCLGLNEAFKNLGLSKKDTDIYLKAAGNPVITKTHGRRPIAFLNKAVDNFYALPADLDGGTMFQHHICDYINGSACRAAGRQITGTPRRFFMQDIQSLGIE